MPFVTVRSSSCIFDGAAHSVAATAVGADGMTPVGGIFRILYNGSTEPPSAVGSYVVIACFTSKDPDYVNTVAYGVLHIVKARPIRSGSPASPVVSAKQL